MNLREVSYLRPANNYKSERAICLLTLTRLTLSTLSFSRQERLKIKPKEWACRKDYTTNKRAKDKGKIMLPSFSFIMRDKEIKVNFVHVSYERKPKIPKNFNQKPIPKDFVFELNKKYSKKLNPFNCLSFRIKCD
ncbi:hypothetical protein [Helicobacter cetorum]|uniref:hypothetical protein n=1 Tax=Helicobacter cetorum TaxID=138563 RepID=UPI000CF08CC3|nr:hypothetical protein [Helicobacter cetorum]